MPRARRHVGARLHAALKLQVPTNKQRHPPIYPASNTVLPAAANFSIALSKTTHSPARKSSLASQI